MKSIRQLLLGFFGNSFMSLKSFQSEKLRIRIDLCGFKVTRVETCWWWEGKLTQSPSPFFRPCRCWNTGWKHIPRPQKLHKRGLKTYIWTDSSTWSFWRGEFGKQHYSFVSLIPLASEKQFSQLSGGQVNWGSGRLRYLNHRSGKW